MFLVAAVSLRACRAIVDLIYGYVPFFQAIPAPNTIQSWLLRIGLHELQRPKERADDWAFLLDHTIQSLKVKGRCMNLGPLIGWGTRMLQPVDTPAADHLGKGPLERLDEKSGWIEEYRGTLLEWEELHTIKDSVLDPLRIRGYRANAAEEVSRK